MQVQNITPESRNSSSTLIPLSDIESHVQELFEKGKPLPHGEILIHLLEKIEPVDFQLLAFPEVSQLFNELNKLESQLTGGNGAFQDDQVTREKIKALKTQLEKKKLKQPHYLIITIEQVLALAMQNQWDICRNHNFIYLFNGAYWSLLDDNELKTFLGKAAEQMGVEKFKARYYQFREHLFKQFLATAHLPTPERPKDAVFVNLQNGTFEITGQGTRLREFRREDFITYQLPFKYDATAKAPLFEQYLNRVLPDKDRQKILAEYLGYVFISPGTLKLEKTLLLYGTGANGKSVFFEIVNALLGSENVSSYSLQSLTNDTGYFRAKLANMLVNYASEINGNLETAIFKQLVSGEPVEARLPYGEPFTLTHYAKLVFNCNELPKDVEHSNAYFRRFLIVPFDVTIPEADQDKELPKKIIQQELSGVFNWVLDGLNRLLTQKQFTDCEAVRLQLEQYKKQSDSVQMFLEDYNYVASTHSYRPQKDLFAEYRGFCQDNGYKPVQSNNFKKRLHAAGIVIEKKNIGLVAFVERGQTF
jgi:putative DNA primase/helicase